MTAVVPGVALADAMSEARATRRAAPVRSRWPSAHRTAGAAPHLMLRPPCGTAARWRQAWRAESRSTSWLLPWGSLLTSLAVADGFLLERTMVVAVAAGAGATMGVCCSPRRCLRRAGRLGDCNLSPFRHLCLIKGQREERATRSSPRRDSYSTNGDGIHHHRAGRAGSHRGDSIRGHAAPARGRRVGGGSSDR